MALTRVVYPEGHRLEFQEHFINSNGDVVQVRHLERHPLFGQLHTINGDWTWIEYLDCYKNKQIRRRVSYYEKGQLRYNKYKKGHPFMHGVIQYFTYPSDTDENIELYLSKPYLSRVEYEPHHPGHGEIRYYSPYKVMEATGEAVLNRIEYDKWHIDYGKIVYYDENAAPSLQLSKMVFTNHYIEQDMRGEVYFFNQSGNVIRKEFLEGHRLHKMILHFDPSTGEQTRHEYQKDHCALCRVGSFVSRPENWICDNCFYSRQGQASQASQAAQHLHSNSPDASRRVPAYYQDGEVSAEKTRTEAELAELAEKRKARRQSVGQPPACTKPPSTRNGKQKVNYPKLPICNPERQLCRDIIAADNRKSEKQCPTCAKWLSRTATNSNHISCDECKTEFCFLCMTRLKGHKEASMGVLHFGSTGSVCPQHGDGV